MSYNLSGAQLAIHPGGRVTRSGTGSNGSASGVETGAQSWTRKPTTKFTWFDKPPDLAIDSYFRARDGLLEIMDGKKEADTYEGFLHQLDGLEIASRWCGAAARTACSDLPHLEYARQVAHAREVGERFESHFKSFCTSLTRLRELSSAHRATTRSQVAQYRSTNGGEAATDSSPASSPAVTQCIADLVNTMKEVDKSVGEIFEIFEERQKRCPKPYTYSVSGTVSAGRPSALVSYDGGENTTMGHGANEDGLNHTRGSEDWSDDEDGIARATGQLSGPRYVGEHSQPFPMSANVYPTTLSRRGGWGNPTATQTAYTSAAGQESHRGESSSGPRDDRSHGSRDLQDEQTKLHIPEQSSRSQHGRGAPKGEGRHHQDGHKRPGNGRPKGEKKQRKGSSSRDGLLSTLFASKR